MWPYNHMGNNLIAFYHICWKDPGLRDPYRSVDLESGFLLLLPASCFDFHSPDVRSRSPEQTPNGHSDELERIPLNHRRPRSGEWYELFEISIPFRKHTNNNDNSLVTHSNHKIPQNTFHAPSSFRGSYKSTTYSSYRDLYPFQ